MRWQRTWSAELGAIHESLGGEAWVPAALLRTVLETPGPHRKGVAVLYSRGEPWALVPLRLSGEYWEPLLQGVIDPRFPFVARDRDSEVLGALGLSIGCWAATNDCEGWDGVRWKTRQVAYDLNLSADPREHWRRTDLWKTIAQSLRRTGDFEVVLDDMAAAEWVTCHWRERWSTGRPGEIAAKWADRLAATRWGIEHGTAHVWAIRDGAGWVSGVTGFVRDEELHVLSVYRDQRYDWHNVGHRAIYETFSWAYQNGLKSVSLGVDFDYKRRWATPSAPRWSFIVSPFPAHLVQGGVARARALIGGRGAAG